MLTELVDVSERMEAAEALRASELLLRRLIEALPLEQAPAAYERMMAGKARFRMVLTA